MQTDAVNYTYSVYPDKEKNKLTMIKTKKVEDKV